MLQNFVVPEVRPKTDLELVSQVGAVDLRLAYATGIIEGDIESVEGNFNGIEDPSSIMGKPDDIFSAYRASSAFSEAVTASQSTPSESPE